MSKCHIVGNLMHWLIFKLLLVDLAASDEVIPNILFVVASIVCEGFVLCPYKCSSS